MRHLDLFSGIGGFALAASWVWGDEHEIVGFCEIDSFCQKVLKKHWPDAPIYPDIKELKGNQFDTVELITGGFPCQPFSVAGKRKGAEDDRALWPEMFRVIKETRPRWIIAENVPGIINMELDTVLSDLEDEGYAWEAFIIPAAGVDAPHKRDRVWIVAYSYPAETKRQQRNGGEILSISKSKRFNLGCLHVADTIGAGLAKRESISGNNAKEFSPIKRNGSFANTNKLNGNGKRFQPGEISQQPEAGICEGWQWLPEPKLGRVANGVPNRVDRLKSLGNAIVPQVAAVIMQGIKEVESAF